LAEPFCPATHWNSALLRKRPWAWHWASKSSPDGNSEICKYVIYLRSPEVKTSQQNAFLSSFIRNRMTVLHTLFIQLNFERHLKRFFDRLLRNEVGAAAQR
jgi:hypothetical protein